MKIGIDIHGVGDATPEFFALLSNMITNASEDEIHIITGGMLTKEYTTYIDNLNIDFNKIFSVSEYLIANGTAVRWSDKNNPWFDAELWDRAKADYCKDNNIDIMFDDTLRYAKYFKDINTTFIHFKKIN
jgi:hypothetical protein